MEPVFTIAGGCTLACGLCLYLKRQIFVKRACSSTGVVVKYISVSDIDGKEACFPVIRFKTAGEETVQFKSRISFAPSTHRMGEELPVLYDPRDSRKAEINSFKTLWIFPVSIIVVGLIILFSGLFYNG
jgi:hypothetical protein